MIPKIKYVACPILALILFCVKPISQPTGAPNHTNDQNDIRSPSYIKIDLISIGKRGVDSISDRSYYATVNGAIESDSIIGSIRAYTYDSLGDSAKEIKPVCFYPAYDTMSGIDRSKIFDLKNIRLEQYGPNYSGKYKLVIIARSGHFTDTAIKTFYVVRCNTIYTDKCPYF